MADSLLRVLTRLLRPILTVPARALAAPKTGKTWHYEAVFVAVVLAGIAFFTAPSLPIVFTDPAALKQFLIIWLSAGAVLGSFLHAQIGTFMAEDIGNTPQPVTECYIKLGEYWFYKEILWFLVFFISGAYPAIAGNVIFLIYPVWRKVYKQEREKFIPIPKPL